SIINIHATDGNANKAASIANDTANAFVTTIQNYTQPASGGDPAVRLKVTQFASAPSKPDSPNKTLNIALGILLGLLVGAAVAVARDILDTRIKNADQLAKVTGSPVMGVVVEDAKAGRHPIATRAGAKNMRAENY